MKKIFTFIILAMTMAMSAYAGAPKGQHLEFEGIPINGKISSFANMMPKIGFSYDAETTALLSEGKRAYNGIYNDYLTEAWLCADPKTNLMYGVCLFIDFMDYDDAVDAGIDIVQALMADLDAVYDEDASEDNDLEFEVYNTSGDLVGSISISVLDDDDDEISLMIYYFDETNFAKYNRNK